MQTVYVTRKVALNKFWGLSERSEALPVWQGVKAEDPTLAGDGIDAVTSATPKKEYRTTWALPPEFAGHPDRGQHRGKRLV